MKLLFKSSKYLFVILVISLTPLNINAQDNQPPQNQQTFWNNVRFGGGIGLSFGDGFFSGTLAPSAIYQFNPYFSAGVGLNGTYATLKNRYKSTIIGGSIIALTSPFRALQLSAEFEELNVTRNFDDGLGIENQNYWYPALFLGAGYNTGRVTFGIRYDVLYDEDKSIYADPWAPFVRIYF